MKSTIKPHFKFDDKVDNAMLVYNSKYEVNMHESMEEKNLPYKRVPNNTCNDSLPLECGLDLVTHFQRVGPAKRKVMHKWWWNLANCTWPNWSSSLSSGKKWVDVTFPEMIRWAEHFTSVVFFPQSQNLRLIWRRMVDPNWGHSTKCLTSLLHSCQGQEQ